LKTAGRGSTCHGDVLTRRPLVVLAEESPRRGVLRRCRRMAWLPHYYYWPCPMRGFPSEGADSRVRPPEKACGRSSTSAYVATHKPFAIALDSWLTCMAAEDSPLSGFCRRELEAASLAPLADQYQGDDQPIQSWDIFSHLLSSSAHRVSPSVVQSLCRWSRGPTRTLMTQWGRRRR
jgi:hypothetical protein